MNLSARHLIFLLNAIILLPCFQARCQDTTVFAPIGATWSNSYTSDQLIVRSDTVIDDIPARIMEKDWMCFDHFRQDSCSVKELDFWLRTVDCPEIVMTVDHQVFHLIKDSFYLLYDFAAQIGDTILIHSIERLGSDSIVAFTVVVDALDTVDINGTQLRAYHMRDDYESSIEASFYRFTGWVVERLGKEFYPFPFNNQDEDIYGFPFIAQCYQDNDITHFAVENCVLHSNQISLQDLQVYPNPASDQIYIDLGATTSRHQIKIFNSAGVLLKSIQATQTIDLALDDLPNGFYFLLVDQYRRTPFIINH